MCGRYDRSHDAEVSYVADVGRVPSERGIFEIRIHHVISGKGCECARLFERHIACPIVARRKSSDSQNYINAIAIIERIETMTAKHIGALESAWASLLGDSDTGRRPDLGGSTFGDTEKREVELGKNEP